MRPSKLIRAANELYSQLIHLEMTRGQYRALSAASRSLHDAAKEIDRLRQRVAVLEQNQRDPVCLDEVG